MIQRPSAGAIWALGGGLVLYLAFENGGYGPVTYGQVGTILWWAVLIGALLGVLPARPLPRIAWIAAGLLIGFVAWSELATTWSLSSERSLQAVSEIVVYLGALVLALVSFGDRRSAMRHAVGAVASAIVIVAVFALLSRLRPQTFPGATHPLAFLGGAGGRLSWPLNYWNALAALMAVGLPLLLCIATTARAVAVRLLAGAAVPVLALVAYFTLSRGGVVEGAAAAFVFIALAPRRLPKLATMLACGAASALLIAAAERRVALGSGVDSAAARHQGSSLLVLVVIVCATVALAGAGIELADRRISIPAPPRIAPRTAAGVLAALLIAAAAVILALHVPGHLWSDFKRGGGPAGRGAARFSSLNGEERYTVWKVAIQASAGHVLTGAGPGTFQLIWLPRAPINDYIVNAHSLYVETYAEVGLIGLLLLLAFVAAALRAPLTVLRGTEPETRAAAAAIAASCVAFLVAAALDWVWQMPVLPIAIMALIASSLVSARSAGAPRRDARSRTGVRAGLVALALASLVAIAVPLATATEVGASQQAAASGNLALALADARKALAIEPGAASAELQQALVLEQAGELTPAVAAARRATADEPTDWQTWLILSRLEVETGHPGLAVRAYRRARADNPRSPLFVP